MNKKKLCGDFEWMLKVAGFPAYDKKEHYFAKPVRMWHFDYAWCYLMLAVELEGGIYTHGKPMYKLNPKTKKLTVVQQKSRHLTIKGFEGDCEKYNAAELMGWTLLRFTAGMIASGLALTTLESAFADKTLNKNDN